VNLYQYANGNPVANIDPTGEFAVLRNAARRLAAPVVNAAARIVQPVVRAATAVVNAVVEPVREVATRAAIAVYNNVIAPVIDAATNVISRVTNSLMPADQPSTSGSGGFLGSIQRGISALANISNLFWNLFITQRT